MPRRSRRMNDPMPLGFNEENLEIPMNANNEHFVNVPEQNNLNKTIEDPSIVEVANTNPSQRRRKSRRNRKNRKSRKSRRN